MSEPADIRRRRHQNRTNPLGGPEGRRDALVNKVMSAGTMRIEDLPEEFGVSLMTVHRDLDVLAAQGLLRKSRGTVTALASSLSESSTEFRTRLNIDAKRAIASVALDMIEPGQAIILDDSTTGLFLTAQLHTRQPLTVISNFQPAIDSLIDHPEITLIMLGGQYYPWCRAYMGSVTLNALQNLRADMFFASSSAVTDGICFHQHHDTVLVKRAMFEAARTRVAYLDHSKFEQRALHAFGPLSDFDVVIVDAETSPDQLRLIERSGVNLIIAPSNTAHPKTAPHTVPTSKDA